MKVFTSLKIYMLRIWHSVYFKYVSVCILGIIIVGFLDENSVWAHLRNQQHIQQLADETEMYNERFRRDQAKIRELDKDPKAMEKIARERYFMKADDEDIFVLSDDEKVSGSVMNHETTE